MRYASIRKMDISNGEGIRVSLFVQGCDQHCYGCFNQETWDWDGGEEFTEETLLHLLDLCSKPYIKGLSILGGEPLHPNNAKTVGLICSAFKKAYPDKDIWLWTGYRVSFDEISGVLDNVDVVIDGKYIDDLRDLSLKWRGSSNQRIWRKSGDTFKEEGE